MRCNLIYLPDLINSDQFRQLLKAYIQVEDDKKRNTLKMLKAENASEVLEEFQ